MKVGVFTGRFKPPHKGHKHVIDRALEDNDHVRVFVSGNPEDGIDAETAVNVFREYFGDNPKIKYEISKESPVKSAYGFINKLGKWEKAHKSELNLYSEPKDMKRWDHVDKFKGNVAKVNRIETERPSFGDRQLHAEDMRKFLDQDDFDSFKLGIPDGTDPQKIWDILKEAMVVSADSYKLKDQVSTREPNVIPSSRFGYPTMGTTYLAENKVARFDEFNKKK